MTNRMVYQSVSGQTIAPCPAQLLITSFDTWLPHQRSNAADDLIQQAIERQDLPPDVLLLRHLPVDNTAASLPVCHYIERFQPTVILCCGMAESRSRLSLEQQAARNGHTRQTSLPLAAWCETLPVTDLSHDAGQFVCNDLYYQVLGYNSAPATSSGSGSSSRSSSSSSSRSSQTCHAAFLHVPPLTLANRLPYAQDFAAIVNACMAVSLTEGSNYGNQQGPDFSK